MSIPAINAIGALGSAAGISPIGGLGSQAQILPGSGSTAATSGAGGGFAQALTQAVSSLQAGQNTANSASQALATGQVSDPTQAITAVEEAQLEMELASQVSTKVVADVQTIFQTAV